MAPALASGNGRQVDGSRKDPRGGQAPPKTAEPREREERSRPPAPGRSPTRALPRRRAPTRAHTCTLYLGSCPASPDPRECRSPWGQMPWGTTSPVSPLCPEETRAGRRGATCKTSKVRLCWGWRSWSPGVQVERGRERWRGVVGEEGQVPPVVRIWRLEMLICPGRWATGGRLQTVMMKTWRMAFCGVCAVLPASPGNVTGVPSGHDAMSVCRGEQGQLSSG